MTTVFADSLYWVVIVRPNDQWNELAQRAKSAVEDPILVTTDDVLSEFLTALSASGPRLREAAVQMVRAILKNRNVRVVPQTHQGFLRGLELFDSRDDKQYSLTDCISMNVMKSDGIQKALTNDHHFQQEGFTVLIEKASS